MPWTLPSATATRQKTAIDFSFTQSLSDLSVISALMSAKLRSFDWSSSS